MGYQVILKKSHPIINRQFYTIDFSQAPDIAQTIAGAVSGLGMGNVINRLTHFKNFKDKNGSV